MSAHTAGPWAKRMGGSQFVTIVAPDESLIAKVRKPDDARAICALPDLLEALRSARQFIRNGVEFGYIRMPDAETPDTAHDTLPEIEAAIAKATGATP